MLTKEDLRQKYTLILWMEEFCKENNKSKLSADSATKYLKREIRDALKAQEKRRQAEPEWRRWHGYDDMPYCRLEYDWVFTDEEAQEYIDEYWVPWRDIYGDGRDCTGCVFTKFLYVFPLPSSNKTVVYHVMGYDWQKGGWL